jgi:hypothetical protein
MMVTAWQQRVTAPAAYDYSAAVLG